MEILTVREAEFYHSTLESEVGLGHRLTRRDVLRAATGLALAPSSAFSNASAAKADPDVCRDDVAIDSTTAMIFSAEAPLRPAAGLRDARAVWNRVPESPNRSVLVYLHGHNGYVTVDPSGKSRVPDWAAADAAARSGASAKKAAPLVYGLDRLDAPAPGKVPIVLVPEDSTLATGSFWAKEPAGQYAEPERLGSLVRDGLKHLACLRRPGGQPYLSNEFLQSVTPARPGTSTHLQLNRFYLCGHSGAGLPLEEAALSSLILPGSGVPTDLWLFDCTYWSQVAGFISFCKAWKAAGRLDGGRQDAARFVCVYRPKTQTEEVADTLRDSLAELLGVSVESLVKDHSPTNFETDVGPALKRSGVLFVRTYISHDEIPTFFIPALLRTAAS
jgi:hypothetical protein